jgi:hypothetical protein
MQFLRPTDDSYTFLFDESEAKGKVTLTQSAYGLNLYVDNAYVCFLDLFGPARLCGPARLVFSDGEGGPPLGHLWISLNGENSLALAPGKATDNEPSTE